jgi:hypothetical protein
MPRARLIRRRAAERARQCARDPEQVLTRIRVELQRLRETLQNLVGRPPAPALLEAEVVLRADAGETGDLIPPQPGDPASAVAEKADVFGLNDIPPGFQKCSESDHVDCHPAVPS